MTTLLFDSNRKSYAVCRTVTLTTLNCVFLSVASRPSYVWNTYSCALQIWCTGHVYCGSGQVMINRTERVVVGVLHQDRDTQRWNSTWTALCAAAFSIYGNYDLLDDPFRPTPCAHLFISSLLTVTLSSMESPSASSNVYRRCCMPPHDSLLVNDATSTSHTDAPWHTTLAAGEPATIRYDTIR